MLKTSSISVFQTAGSPLSGIIKESLCSPLVRDRLLTKLPCWFCYHIDTKLLWHLDCQVTAFIFFSCWAGASHLEWAIFIWGYSFTGNHQKVVRK